jgi:hypothetical protein
MPASCPGGPVSARPGLVASPAARAGRGTRYSLAIPTIVTRISRTRARRSHHNCASQIQSRWANRTAGLLRDRRSVPEQVVVEDHVAVESTRLGRKRRPRRRRGAWTRVRHNRCKFCRWTSSSISAVPACTRLRKRLESPSRGPRAVADHGPRPDPGSPRLLGRLFHLGSGPRGRKAGAVTAGRSDIGVRSVSTGGVPVVIDAESAHAAGARLDWRETSRKRIPLRPPEPTTTPRSSYARRPPGLRHEGVEDLVRINSQLRRTVAGRRRREDGVAPRFIGGATVAGSSASRSNRRRGADQGALPRSSGRRR